MGCRMSSKVVFLTIGYIEWRKGQDLLIDANEMLPEEVKEKTEFIMIGQKNSLMAKELEKRIESLPSVSMYGTVSREEIHNILEKADVMICPSREDPMPTVCAEAMMHEVPCIVSSATGTAEYITNGHNGLIFESENVEQLKEAILWCIKNRTELKEIGKRSYEIYDKVFSEKAFEKNLLKYVEEMIGKVTS